MKKLTSKNNLKVLYPKVAKEWHPTKNEPLTPKDVVPGSHKKIWWLCNNGHHWFTEIRLRTVREYGCPECSGRKVGKDNNLFFKFPEIAKEWHKTKNGKLTPKSVTSKSHKDIWWKFSEGHDWKAQVKTRSTGHGCPKCFNENRGNLIIKAALKKSGNLKSVFPDIAKEWHSTKNEQLSPSDRSPGSAKIVWWRCIKNAQHEWQATIGNRTGNLSGCPLCTSQTSYPEIRILTELKYIFEEVQSRKRFDGVEADIFLPKLNLIIEYDGSYFHRNKEKSDLKKNLFFRKNKCTVFRIRHAPLKKISKMDLIVKNDVLKKTDLNNIFSKLIPLSDSIDKKNIAIYLKQDTFQNDILFKEYVSYFPSPFPENSLLIREKKLAEQWNFDKNFPLRPENFTPGSGKEVWWLCENGHEYETRITEGRQSKLRV